MKTILAFSVFFSLLYLASATPPSPFTPLGDTTNNDSFEDGVSDFTEYLYPKLLLVKSCNCSSGCGFSTKGLTKKMLAFKKAIERKGARAFSCKRTKDCQNRLRRCFTRCGQPGRAAKNSKHVTGRACDFSNAGRLKNWAKSQGFSTYNGKHYSH